MRVILWSGVEWVVTMPSVAGDESVRPRCGGGERASCALGAGCVSTEEPGERCGSSCNGTLRFVFLLQRNGTRVAVGNVKRAQLFEYFLDGVARLTVAVTGTVLFYVTDGCTRGKPESNGPWQSLTCTASVTQNRQKRAKFTKTKRSRLRVAALETVTGRAQRIPQAPKHTQHSPSPTTLTRPPLRTIHRTDSTQRLVRKSQTDATCSQADLGPTACDVVRACKK